MSKINNTKIEISNEKNNAEVVGGNTKTPTTNGKKKNCKRLPEFKNYCFTYYPDNADVLPVLEIENAEYVLMGFEECPKTKKMHYQSFIYWTKKITITTCINRLKKHFNKAVHVEVCKGSIEDNIKYCSKDGKTLEYGTKPKGQGARTDLNTIKDKILNHELTADDICVNEPEFYHQYGRTLNKLEDIALRRKFRTEMTEGIWLYGSTGVGKSHEAFKNYNPDTHYLFPNDNGWWDGYKGQETVIINDFRGNIQYSELLELVDKWPKTVRRRNREPAPFISKKIIITSSLKPNEVYHNLAINDNLDQIYRRFEIINMNPKEINNESELDKDLFTDNETNNKI